VSRTLSITCPSILSLSLFLSIAVLKVKLGIQYWKLNPEADSYPVKAVPWDPKESKDPELAAIRDARGYSYADIITVHPDHLPEFATKVLAISNCLFVVGFFVGLEFLRCAWPLNVGSRSSAASLHKRETNAFLSRGVDC